MRTTILLFSAALVSLLMGCSEPSSMDAAKSGAPLQTQTASRSEGDKALPLVEINLTNRQVVRNGEIQIRVTDVEDAEKKSQQIVRQAGGFVSDSSTTNLAAESSRMDMTARVPVALFDDILASLSTLGTVEHKSTSATDVTGQVADMGARLKVMRAQEEVYLRTMKQTGNLKDTISIQDELMKLRERIEGTEAQLKAQRDQAAFSSIKVTLVGATKPMATAKADNWVVDSFVDSCNRLLAVMAVLGRILITFGVFAPLWAPVAWLGWRWYRRTHPTPPPVMTA